MCGVATYNNNAILKTYIHANNQVIAQHDGDNTAVKYFYLHDRLGSVRMVINAGGAVVNHYTYDSWGLPVETAETISNMYLFANYVWDSEISQYHCYRRQYDPVLARFTSRDPVEGSYEEPLTLHKYLYCGNDAINRTDPTGEQGNALAWGIVGDLVGGMNAYNVGLAAGIDAAGGDPWAIMDVAIVANSFRETYFEQKNLTDRAFGAAECVGQARGNFMISLMDCVTSGIRDQTIVAAGCVAGCVFTGPAMPACLTACGVGTEVGMLGADTLCMIKAAGSYSQNMKSCSNK